MGIPAWGYPAVSFEPCITKVSGCLPASRTPRQPSFFSVGTAPLTMVGSSRYRFGEKVRLLVPLTGSSVGGLTAPTGFSTRSQLVSASLPRQRLVVFNNITMNVKLMKEEFCGYA